MTKVNYPLMNIINKRDTNGHLMNRIRQSKQNDNKKTKETEAHSN